MRVLVLGSGVIGTTVAYYLARSGHEVTVVDRQPGPALETSFANAGQVSPGYSAPWAGPGIPLKAIKWLLMQHSAAGRSGRTADPRHVALGRPMLRNCTAARYASTRRAWCGSPNTAATACRSCAPRPASPTTSARRARCSCSAPRSSSTARQATSRCCSESGVPFELLDRAGCVAAEPALAARAAEVRRRPAAAGRRDRRLLLFTQRPGRRWRSGLGVDLPLRRDDRGPDDRRRPHHGRARPTPGRARRRPLRAGARQLLAAAAARRSGCDCRSIRSRATR